MTVDITRYSIFKRNMSEGHSTSTVERYLEDIPQHAEGVSIGFTIERAHQCTCT